MKNFDTRAYNISDFIEWNNNGLLELSPDFQRRSVWSEKAKSYLIDTILRGKPIPKIIISQKLQKSKNVRVVVDGQQRLRAILEFYNGDFKVSKIHNTEFAGLVFDELPSDIKNEFFKYELGVDLLFDISYEDILDIFARINSYTASLKNQEIYNAKYVGYFKNYVFEYGLKYVQYFLGGKILTKASVARMGEAELSADLIVALLAGVQTNKGIETFYKRYEDVEDGLPGAKEKFDLIMSYIGEIYPPEDICNTNWQRIHLFYSMFVSIGHMLFGIIGLNAEYQKEITQKDIGKIRVALDDISNRYDQYLEAKDDEIPDDFQRFKHYSQRGTTDTAARVYRSDFICKYIKDKLG